MIDIKGSTMGNDDSSNLNDYIFWDEKSWPVKILMSASQKTTLFFGNTFIAPPISRKKQLTLRQYLSGKTGPDLSTLGKVAGFDDATSQNYLAYHKQRFNNYVKSIAFLPILFINSLYILLLFGFIGLYNYYLNQVASNYLEVTATFLNFASSTWGALLIPLFFFLLLYLIFTVSVRSTQFFIGKRYAGTLCVVLSIFLVIELSRDDPFFPPARKKSILAKINDLARNTLLLPFAYSSKSENNKVWARQHFKTLEAVIRERERWVIAPTKSTQDDLRRDFFKLGQLYMSGQFGDHDWQVDAVSIEKSKELSAMQKVLRSIFIVLPVVLLGLLFSYPTIQETLGVDATVITIFLISWLLLVIDDSLNLGIVERLSSFVKIIRDLR